MAVEFYSWDGQSEMTRLGRVEDGEVVEDDDVGTLESIIEFEEDRSDEALVQRFQGPKLVAEVVEE